MKNLTRCLPSFAKKSHVKLLATTKMLAAALIVSVGGIFSGAADAVTVVSRDFTFTVLAEYDNGWAGFGECEPSSASASTWGFGVSTCDAWMDPASPYQTQNLSISLKSAKKSVDWNALQLKIVLTDDLGWQPGAYSSSFFSDEGSPYWPRYYGPLPFRASPGTRAFELREPLLGASTTTELKFNVYVSLTGLLVQGEYCDYDVGCTYYEQLNKPSAGVELIFNSAPIPEPSSVLLLLSGLAVMVAGTRQRIAEVSYME